MIGRKKTITVEIPEEIRDALVSLNTETTALTGLLQELVENQRRTLDALMHTISENGVKVYDEPDVEEDPTGVQRLRMKQQEDTESIPVTMSHQTFEETSEASNNRVRSSPFTRVPRHRQAAWLKSIMKDGEWYAPITLARTYATDERHYRYLRSAIGGRLREMHEEGLLDRRSSDVKGAMFEYKVMEGGDASDA